MEITKFVSISNLRYIFKISPYIPIVHQKCKFLSIEVHGDIYASCDKKRNLLHVDNNTDDLKD